jgi:hypothetical protein
MQLLELQIDVTSLMRIKEAHAVDWQLQSQGNYYKHILTLCRYVYRWQCVCIIHQVASTNALQRI